MTNIIEEILKIILGTTAEVTVWAIFIAWLIFIGILFVIIGIPLILILWFFVIKPRRKKKEKRDGEETFRTCQNLEGIELEECQRRMEQAKN